MGVPSEAGGEGEDESEAEGLSRPFQPLVPR